MLIGNYVKNLRGAKLDCFHFKDIIFFFFFLGGGGGGSVPVKGNAKAPGVDLLRLNALRDMKIALLTPKRYKKYCPFIWDSPLCCIHVYTVSSRCTLSTLRVYSFFPSLNTSQHCHIACTTTHIAQKQCREGDQVVVIHR